MLTIRRELLHGVPRRCHLLSTRGQALSQPPRARPRHTTQTRLQRDIRKMTPQVEGSFADRIAVPVESLGQKVMKDAQILLTRAWISKKRRSQELNNNSKLRHSRNSNLNLSGITPMVGSNRNSSRPLVNRSTSFKLRSLVSSVRGGRILS